MSDRWNRILQIALEASTLDADQREATIREMCGNDTALMEEVLSLLTAETPGDELLAGPIADKVEEILAEQFDLVPGRIGPYALDHVIAQGGHGVVYKAHRADEAFERHVAIKLLLNAELSRKGALRFAHERRLLAALDHPNIARVIDGGTTEAGSPFMVMEFVDGRPIIEYADAHKLSIRARLQLFLQVCRAVQYAHQRLVVHRDLKPPNILVTESGAVRLLDFGVAKFLDDHVHGAADRTATGRFSFTLQYASPEQVTNKAVTTLSDIYSLGLVLYELLTGRLPYRVESGLHETLRSICERDPPRPSTLRQGINAELDAIVFQALAKSPARRYPTVESFAKDIERFLSGDAVLAHPPARAYRLRKFIRRHCWSVLSVSCVFVLVSAFGAIAWQQAIKAAAAANRVENEKQKVEQVNRLLGDILTSVEPHGRDVTVREMLDDAVQYARNEIDDSEVRVELFATVVKAYRSLGLYEQAETLAVEALRLSKRDLGEEHVRTLNLTTGLAGLYAQRGRFQESRELIRKAIEVKRRVLGDDHLYTLRDRSTLLTIHLHSEHFHEAIAVGTEVLAAQRRILGVGHPETLHTMRVLAVACKAQGRVQESEKLLAEVVRCRRRTLGIEHVHTLIAIEELASIYSAQRRFTEAETLYAEVVATQERVLGETDELTLESKYLRAQNYIEMGRYGEAEQLLRESLDAYKRSRGDEFAKATNAAHLLGWLFFTIGRCNEAESLLSDGLEACINQNGSEHPMVLVFRGTLTLALIKLGRYIEAELQIRSLLGSQERSFGVNHRRTLWSKSILAAICVRQHRAIDAAFYGEEALDAQRRLLGGEHQEVLSTMETLAQAYHRQDRLNEAEQLLVEVVEARRSTWGDQHLATLGSMHELGNVYLAQERYVQAESMYQHALNGRRRTFGAGHPDTISSKLMLAYAYYLGGCLEQACELCLELAELRDTTSPDLACTGCLWSELTAACGVNDALDEGHAPGK